MIKVISGYNCCKSKSKKSLEKINQVRNLAAGMALTYCRDALHQSIVSNLRNNLMTVLKMSTSSPPEYRQILEHTVEEVAKDNIDLACNIVQKGAIVQSDKYINDALKQVRIYIFIYDKVWCLKKQK